MDDTINNLTTEELTYIAIILVLAAFALIGVGYSFVMGRSDD